MEVTDVDWSQRGFKYLFPPPELENTSPLRPHGGGGGSSSRLYLVLEQQLCLSTSARNRACSLLSSLAGLYSGPGGRGSQLELPLRGEERGAAEQRFWVTACKAPCVWSCSNNAECPVV